MFLHKKKSIWDSPIKLVGLWIIITCIYLALNKIALHVFKYHESLWILSLVMVLTIGIAIAILIYTLKQQKNYSKVKFHLVHKIIMIVLGVIAIFIMESISSILMIIHKVNTVSRNQKILDTSLYSSKYGIIYSILIVCIAGPIIEEFLCRFLIIGPNPRGHHLVSKSVYLIRIMVGTFIFAFMHMLPQLKYVTNLSAFWLLLLQFFPYLVISIILTYEYVHTQDYKVSVATHMINNLIATLLPFFA